MNLIFGSKVGYLRCIYGGYTLCALLQMSGKDFVYHSNLRCNLQLIPDAITTEPESLSLPLRFLARAIKNSLHGHASYAYKMYIQDTDTQYNNGYSLHAVDKN